MRKVQIVLALQQKEFLKLYLKQLYLNIYCVSKCLQYLQECKSDQINLHKKTHNDDMSYKSFRRQVTLQNPTQSNLTNRSVVFHATH